MKFIYNYHQFVKEAQTEAEATRPGVEEKPGEAKDFSVAKDVEAKKNQWTKLAIPTDKTKKDEYENEFFNLIQTAYKEIGGYAKIKGPDDVFADTTWDVWQGIDIDQDPDFDIIVWGETTPYGIKSCGVGHDGSQEARKGYIQKKGEEFNNKSTNYYGEVSDKLAAILINKYNVPVVEDEDKVREVVGREKVEEFYGIHPENKSGDPKDRDRPGKGWYKRKIGGHYHNKILVGNPKI